MKITNDQPIPFRVTLTDTETAAFLTELVNRFGSSLPSGLLSGRTITSIQFTFTNQASQAQVGTGSLQIATIPTPPITVAAAPAPATTATITPAQAAKSSLN